MKIGHRPKLRRFARMPSVQRPNSVQAVQDMLQRMNLAGRPTIRTILGDPNKRVTFGESQQELVAASNSARKT